MIETEATETTSDGARPLPDGWRWVRLGDVCELNPRRPPIERAEDAATSFIPMAVVYDGGRGIAQFEVKPFGEVQRGYTYFGNEDVLFAKITPCMQNGKIAVVRDLIDGIGFGSTEFHVLRSGHLIQPDWMQLFLRQQAILDDAERHMTGAVGQQRLPTSYLADTLIPIPPLPEQRRIAAILRERLAAVEQARAAAAAQLAAAQALPAAYLRTVFESDEAQAWPRVRLGDTAKVQSGYAFKSEWFVDDGIRLLRNANIFQDYISWEDQVCLPYERRGEFSAFELCDGDIVLSLDRPLVSNGLKIARISQQDLPCLLLQRVARFQIHDDLDVDFLYTFLHTDAFITAITQHDQSLGVPHVSPKQVETILIPYPPVAEQRRIAADLHDRLVEVERVSMNLQEQLEEIVALPQALLRQAFAGEL
jgi:type I restriction enzyme S subunit